MKIEDPDLIDMWLAVATKQGMHGYDCPRCRKGFWHLPVKGEDDRAHCPHCPHCALKCKRAVRPIETQEVGDP